MSSTRKGKTKSAEKDGEFTLTEKMFDDWLCENWGSQDTFCPHPVSRKMYDRLPENLKPLFMIYNIQEDK